MSDIEFKLGGGNSESVFTLTSASQTKAKDETRCYVELTSTAQRNKAKTIFYDQGFAVHDGGAYRPKFSANPPSTLMI